MSVRCCFIKGGAKETSEQGPGRQEEAGPKGTAPSEMWRKELRQSLGNTDIQRIDRRKQTEKEQSQRQEEDSQKIILIKLYRKN